MRSGSQWGFTWLNKKAALNIDLSELLLNCCLNISFLANTESRRACAVLPLLPKPIHNAHTPKVKAQHPPSTPSQLCPTANQGIGVACKCFPGGSRRGFCGLEMNLDGS